MKTRADALLVLEDGMAFCGCSFGAQKDSLGELVFNTAMSGYQETLTDPSYHKQIVVETFPHIGNTGVNEDDNESKRVWVAGFVVKTLSQNYSNWRATDSLESLLESNGVVGIEGLDTRFLTRYLRDNGAKKAGIFVGLQLDEAIGDRIAAPAELLEKVRAQEEMAGAHLAQEVTTAAPESFAAGGKIAGFGGSILKSLTHIEPSSRTLRVASIDLGIKSMTPQMLSERNVEVINVPLNSTFEEIEALGVDGIFYSNGPGDPGAATSEVELLRQLLKKRYPFFGICMGNQILGRALGFGTYKLKFGHRGINQPVKDLESGIVEITAHNHGFAVDLPLGELDEFGNATNPPAVQAPFEDGIFGRAQVSHINLNDNCVEGIKCLDLPAFSVQYHPEAAAGPHDSAYLFDRFVKLMLDNPRT
ncbi:MAG: glutamine-hydrolyzing carbamoyl-phosphate synthase small subunit [Candidatus Ancillula sp.]|nr:glutamine-hydrolyzing carbamoyl-phosphate synthase small subunit [Candidatus Ancillula sp.]